MFWKILSAFFLGNNLKGKLMSLLIFHHQSHIWQNSGSWIMDQNTVSQSNWYSWNCNILRKKWIMKFIFGLQINIEVFYKLIQSLWICVTRHAQSTQNEKFEYLCNYLLKTMGDEVGFFCLYINLNVFYKTIV